MSLKCEMAECWNIKATDDAASLGPILEFLLEEFARMFGLATMHNEKCIVYNDPHAECPMLIINRNPIAIRIAQENCSYWCQTIYQLSHEMCHYTFRQHQEVRDFTLSWFEEIICEAVSLYALEYASKYWSRCVLSQQDPEFYKSIQQYLQEVHDEEPTAEFKNCNTIAKLNAYESQRIAERLRASQVTERNQVYTLISDRPTEARCILNYSQYVMSNRVTIDFRRWINDSPCKLLEELSAIQPIGG